MVSYFCQEGKEKFLNAKQRKQLVGFFRSVDPKDRNNRTYWQKAVDAWNDNNSKHRLPLDLSMPDYTGLAYHGLPEMARIGFFDTKGPSKSTWTMFLSWNVVWMK
jgi:hypothetical protein